jgi:glutathione S-transferase
MKLYETKTAPNCRRVRIFLAEKGIEVETVQIDLANLEQRSPQYLAKNPMGRVPVLELDDGTYLAESVAICHYFEEVQPEPPLMGIDGRDRAEVVMWQRRMELDVALPIMQVFRNTHEFFKGKIPQVPEFAQVCRESALERLAWLETVLAEREFIAGERFTIADITALIGIDFGRVSGIRIGEDQPNLARWHRTVSSRPSAKA